MPATRLARTCLLSLALSSVLAGCASRAQTSAAATAAAASAQATAAPAKKIKLAVLPAEKFLLPKVAEGLNQRLGQAVVPGVDETAIASISMEIAQLQAECAEAGEACWIRVAQMVSADRLVWAEMERATKRKRGPVKVRVFLFDAEKAAVVGQAEATFTGKATDAQLDQLVGQALGTTGPVVPPPVAATAQPATAAPAATPTVSRPR